MSVVNPMPIPEINVTIGVLLSIRLFGGLEQAGEFVKEAGEPAGIVEPSDEYLHDFGDELDRKRVNEGRNLCCHG